MKTRKLGKDGPEISVIGFGAWALGGGGWQFGWGPQEDANSVKAIHEAIDVGVNWLDTAAVYGLGHSEEVVGKALADRRDKMLVATKCSLRWNDKGKIYRDHSPEGITTEIDASLKRLGIETIDLYQIHWPPGELEKIAPAMEAIKAAVEAGKIRYVGVSNFDAEQMAAATAVHPVTSLQPPYNMIRRGIEASILPYCEEHGIGVVPYSPMASGLLTGKYDAASIAALADDDWRKQSDAFKEPALSANLALLDGLRPIAEKHGASLAQLAVAWTLHHPAVTSAIVGARRPGQITETAKAAEILLHEGDLSEIQALIAARDEAVKG